MQINKINFQPAKQSFLAKTKKQKAELKYKNEHKTANLPLSAFKDYLIGIEGFKYQVRNNLKLFDDDYADIIQDTNTTTLDNNVKVSIDTKYDFVQPASILRFTPSKKLKSNLATMYVLKNMLNNHSLIVQNEEKTEDFSLDTNFYYDISGLSANLNCDHTILNEGVRNLVKVLQDPQLTQEKLDKAKNHEKEVLKDSYYSGYLRIDDFILNGNKDLTTEDLDKVTLQDVQNAYSEIMNNSSAHFASSMPKAAYNKCGESIKNELSKLPKMQLETNQKPQIITIPKENIVLKEKNTNNLKDVLYYVIQTDGSLKEDVILSLLAGLFRGLSDIREDELIEKRQYDGFITDCYVDGEGRNKYLEIYSEYTGGKNATDTPKDRQEKLKKASDNIYSLISELMNAPIEETKLNYIKDDIYSEKRKEYYSDGSRNEILLDTYSLGDNSLKTYYNTLQSITPLEIQAAAKKYFAEPHIEFLEE